MSLGTQSDYHLLLKVLIFLSVLGFGLELFVHKVSALLQATAAYSLALFVLNRFFAGFSP
jgi:hypothetical protein